MANKRKSLTQLIKIMFLLLGLCFIFVLFSSISGPSKITNPKNLFDDVQLGETAMRRSGSVKVWATRLSSAQRAQASELDGYVLNANSGCDLKTEVCAVIAATQRAGIDIIFTEQAPKQLTSDTAWFGGFVDPATGDVFDRLGRAYKLGSKPTKKENLRDELMQLKHSN